VKTRTEGVRGGGALASASARGRLRVVLGMLALAGMATPGGARADRRELFTLIGYEAGVSHHQLPVAGDAGTTQYAGALDVTAYYGLTNTLHVGGRLRLNSSSAVRFSAVSVTTADGSVTGDVFLDERGVDVGGIVVWRVNTGYSVAPVLELGAGLAVHEYRNISHYPSGGSVVPLGSRSEAVAYGSGTVLLQYRFRDRWLAAAGVGAQVEGGRTPWSLLVPLRVGMIW
jgi:hypothetical protein